MSKNVKDDWRCHLILKPYLNWVNVFQVTIQIWKALPCGLLGLTHSDVIRNHVEV